MKKSFEIPFILRSEGADPTSVIGGGTGQGGLGDPTQPMSYSAWAASSIASEYDEHEPEGPDMYDYGLWWAECGFTQEQWESIGNNPTDWTTYVVPNL